MIVEVAPGRGPAAVPTADELAAIVTVVESLAAIADPAPSRPVRNRWREAARSFETEPF